MNLKTLLFLKAAAPVVPQVVNLLNVEGTQEKMSGLYNATFSSGTIENDGVGSGNGDFVLWAAEYPAGTYTFSCDWTGDGMSGVRFLCTQDFPGNSGFVSVYGGYYKDIPSKTITVTLAESFGIGVVFLSQSGHTAEPGKIFNMMFESGDSPSPYVPYKA